MQEGIDGDLVGGIENARHGAARLTGALGQCKAAEGIHIGSIKGELTQLAEVDTRCRRIPAFGIREGKLDGNTHVGSTEMRHHGAIGELDHGVNLGLTLHDDVDKVEIAAEQMHGLDTLQTLVHKGGGVNRDLGTHSPGGMRQGIGTRHAIELVTRAAKERATRAGEPNAVGFARILPQIALVDGRMLRVDRNKLTWLRQRHKQIAADDERLFVGKSKALVRGQGRMARLETRRPHNGNKHAVDIIATCKLADSLRTNAELGARGQLLQHGVFTMSGIGHGNRRNRELTGSRNKLGSAGVDGQRRHLKAIGMLTAYIERLGTDRTRAA